MNQGGAVGEQAFNRRRQIRHLQRKADLPADAPAHFDLINRLGLRFEGLWACVWFAMTAVYFRLCCPSAGHRHNKLVDALPIVKACES